MDWLPAGVLETAAGLEWTARSSVGGVGFGLHRGRTAGLGGEFSGRRSYVPGDDLRRVDWALFARSDRLQVREVSRLTDLRTFLLMDWSASMAYREEGGPSKARYAAWIATGVASMLLRGGDAVGLEGWGSELAPSVPARARRDQLARLISALGGVRPGGTGDSAVALSRVADRIGRSGRVVLFTDLLDERLEVTLAALARLRARGAEIAVCRVLTPTELGERTLAAGVFTDPEYPARRFGARGTADPRYGERLEAHLRLVERELIGLDVEHIAMRTDESPARALVRWFRVGG